MEDDPKLSAIRRGMLEPLVLGSVAHTSRYSAEIGTALRDAGFPVQDGTLYPLLSRLRRDGLVDHEWVESPSGPPRKYLTLTDAGRSQLEEFTRYWDELTHIFKTIGGS